MMGPMRITAIALAIGVGALTACQDSPSGPSSRLHPNPGGAARSVSLGDDITETIAAIYPKGLATAAASRWRDIRTQLDAGHPDVAKSMLTQLAQWIIAKVPQTKSLASGESKDHASSRLVLEMSLFVYGGPNTPVPVPSTGDQVAAGLVTPTAPLTLTTQHADGTTGDGGLQIDPGSVAQTAIVTVSEITGAYTDNCSGPLNTQLCQEPKFFQIDIFPHQRLLKIAHAQICHVNSGDLRRPVGDHMNLRVAHAKPADPADYTPGSTIVDGIEILPWNPTVSLLTAPGSPCNTTYAALAPTSPGFLRDAFGAGTTAGRLARFLHDALTPSTAYAIDLGGGADVLSFSPFGLVDPTSVPDLAVQGFTSTSLTVAAGGTLTVPAYTVANVGDATAQTFSIQLYLSADPTITSAATPIGSAVTGGPLVPAASTNLSTSAVIPANTAPGTYYIGPLVTETAGVSETNLANNSASTTVDVTAAPIPNPILQYSSSEQYSTSAGAWDRYSFVVTNSTQIPDALFASSPNLPPCGMNTSASRSWVTIYGGSGAETFCALSSANDLNSTWFAVPRWTQVDSASMVINDRLTNTYYTSNTVPLYGPLFTNFPRTVELDWPAVTGAASYQYTVDFCESWASPDWRNCNIAWNSSNMGGTTANTSAVISFVGDQPGRWNVQALDANGKTIGTATDYKYFLFKTPPA